MMTQKQTGHVVTASRLLDGEVVYKGKDEWVASINDALVLYDDEECAQAMTWAQTQEEACVTTNAYLVAVATGNQIVRPVSLRERIRAQGPTSEIWVGKQSQEKNNVSL